MMKEILSTVMPLKIAGPSPGSEYGENRQLKKKDIW